MVVVALAAWLAMLLHDSQYDLTLAAANLRNVGFVRGIFAVPVAVIAFGASVLIVPISAVATLFFSLRMVTRIDTAEWRAASVKTKALLMVRPQLLTEGGRKDRERVISGYCWLMFGVGLGLLAIFATQ